ncbi:MAG: LD-carboxypeptidase [Balneolaceae bacterium]|nr:LD-carboxypeptidase [Balneolaceae bacterium]
MKRSDFLKLSSIGAIGLPAGMFEANKWADQDLEFKKPKKLENGDTIAFTAPAGVVHDLRDFSRMRNVLESMGLNVVFGEFVRERYGYFAGTDYQRAIDLMRFFDDDSVDAILAVRGGWGCARILPHLDYDVIKANPKIFCGFSDVTTLHLAFLKHCGLMTYTDQMVRQTGQKSLKKVSKKL